MREVYRSHPTGTAGVSARETPAVRVDSRLVQCVPGGFDLGLPQLVGDPVELTAQLDPALAGVGEEAGRVRRLGGPLDAREERAVDAALVRSERDLRDRLVAARALDPDEQGPLGLGPLRVCAATASSFALC